MNNEQVVRIVGLDFETYSDVDLRKHGLARYVASPNFEVLLAAVAHLDEENGGVASVILDFVKNPQDSLDRLAVLLGGCHIVAHNAGFEGAVLSRIGLPQNPAMLIDSAVVARTAGLGSALEACAPQALDVDKLASGKEGIMLFSIPGTYQMNNGDDVFDPQVVADHPQEWEEFQKYCALDAALSLKLVGTLHFATSPEEMHYSACTLRMNFTGWHVDRALVEEMDRRYHENVDEQVRRFRTEVPSAAQLNLSSHPQLVQWCADRGIRAKSFDEQHVAHMLEQVELRLQRLLLDDPHARGYEEVKHLLEVKQILGGSSLKKLRTILDTLTDNDLLFDQYLHAGAPTTLRTSGRSVQMQNLKRLGGKGDDVSELFDPSIRWDNAKMARNLRQVFTARHPDGALVVGDYSAVESRGLAWLAGEEWKLQAYSDGVGVYESQAAKFYGIDIADVVPAQRQFAKVGELSCGYGAGAPAVQEFAGNMGVPLSMGEAKKLVFDFRNTNARTVAFWNALQSALMEVAEIGLAKVLIPEGEIVFETTDAIPSLQKLTQKRLRTLVVRVSVPCRDDPFVMDRIFHGFSSEAGGFRYWKSDDRKTGDLWRPTYIDPKTGYRRHYTLYGGKLAGILTQSLCREIFMSGMSLMTMWAHDLDNVHVVGQLHDELVLDWSPPTRPLEPELQETIASLHKAMSWTNLPGFPLACEIKSDYRYTK